MADVLCPVVVGRQAELAELDAALSAALGGAGRLVFVAGEPGIGKSRLAREVAARARAVGATVVTGRAVPAGQSTPYRPLTEALLQAFRGTPQADDPELRSWFPALSAIVPGLSGGGLGAGGLGAGGLGAGGLGAGGLAGAGEQSAAVLGEAVLRLLRSLSRPAGLVIVLEDLHWADPDSLTVIEYLADNLSAQPVLCLATCRDEPPTAALDLARRLHGRRAAGYLMLARLDESQVTAMARACLPDADQEVIAQVQRTADGVPFLVEEVLAAPGVPASFRDTVRARMAALAEPERHVLQAAAVLGRHFDWQLLAPVTGQPAGVVNRALERGVDQLLLAVQDGAFRFRHALTREAMAADVLPPTRMALAAAALDALEEDRAGFGAGSRDTAADLAVQAGQAVRAGLLLTETGFESLDRGALATAVLTFRQAVSLLGASAARDRAESGLLEALALAGRFEEAMTVGASLVARPGGDAARVRLRLAHAAVAATRWPYARDQLAAATRLLAAEDEAYEVHGSYGVQGSDALRAEVLVLQAEVAMAADDLTEARRLADGALEIAAAGAEARCHALEIVGRGLRLKDLAAAQEAFERALGIAEASGLPFWRLRALHELGTIELFTQNGTRRLGQARQMADELGAMSMVAVLDLQLAAAADGRFDLDELGRRAQDALEISERLGIDGVRAKALLFLLESRALRADRAGTEHYAGLALAAAGDATAEAFVWGAGRAMLALLEDDRDGALRAFERSAEILRGCPHAEPANFRGLRLVVLAAVGDARAAAEIRAAHEAGVTTAFANRGMARYAEAILAGRAGDAGRADELATAGDRELAGYPVWSDLALMHAAEAALADGWGEPRPWLRRARDSFGTHGLDAMARRCGERLGEGVPAGPPESWASLGVTAREADVLQLIAEGLANKEIAARLYLSPRTVEKHVESLLRKTGARSRTQLLAIAGRTT
jgi:DNA-binding CsgD family transcriptional regulator